MSRLWGGKPVRTKVCQDCSIRKSLERFPEFSRGYLGRFSYCYKCQAKRVGTWRRENPDKRQAQERRRSFRAGRRWSGFKNGSKHRGVSVEITVDQWLDVIENQACHYCGGDLPKQGSGLDRKDNTMGYSIGNIVPCCTSCNRTKGDRFTYEEFLEVAVLLRSQRDKRTSR